MNTRQAAHDESRIQSLVRQMTLEEKVSLVTGDTFWTTPPVERLGIPPLKVTDGPNGARGKDFAGSVTSAAFPVGVALAATWNPDLVFRVGEALAEETQSKGAHVLLGPTVNMHRSPLAGRNFEGYSEDPYLAARIAVAYVSGVQSRDVATAIKHLVCNDSEFERQSISSEVRERALREIYLPPFRAAVEEAGTWVVMSAYNKLNGVYCSENAYLLQGILKGEWGFDGLVVSDWFGTYSTVEAANNGLDLEMPGPPVWMGEKLLQAVTAGQVGEEVIDDKVRRLLRVMIQTGALDSPLLAPERAIDKPEHRRLVREAAGEAIVLLKNHDGVLPLSVADISKIAVIGPNAKAAKIQGAGSAAVRPHYVVTPYEGIVKRAGDTIQVAYHLGCASYKIIPLVEPGQVRCGRGNAEQGWRVEYYADVDLVGEPVLSETSAQCEYFWIKDVAPGVPMDRFSARVTGSFTAPDTGMYTFGLISAGLSRLYIDGKEVLDNWTHWQPGGEAFFGMGNPEARIGIHLVAGQHYEIRVDYSKRSVGLAALRLGLLSPLPADALDQAAALAAASDVALLFVGLGSEWESEGFDRPDMDLPAEQLALIEAVAAANPNTVAVLNTGAPVTMPWLDRVAGVVQAWYPGQEAGNAIADVLFGDVNPSGRLPHTWPMRLQDNPAYINYPGENGQVHYGEGIFVGYRYYDKKDIEPLFPFGHGLSYTSFAYNHLSVNAAEYEQPARIQVSVEVTNTGTRAGQEVVQLYVRDPVSNLVRPEKELKAFRKVHLEPGETQTVRFELAHDALAYYDSGQHGWFAEAGEFEVLVGGSSRDIRLRDTFTLTQSSLRRTSRAGEDESVPLSSQSTLAQLLAHEGARQILLKHFPELIGAPQLSMAMDFSLEQVATFVPQILTREKLDALNAEFARLGPVAASEVPTARPPGQ